MQKKRTLIFEIILLIFSLFMLVMTLLVSIRVNQVNDRAAEIQLKAEQLEEENNILQTRYENSISLEELEEYANNVLKMHSARPWQIVYTELEEQPGR